MRRTARFFALCALLITALAVPVPAAVADEQDAITAAQKREMAQIIKEAMRGSDIPGAAVGIWTHDRGHWVKAFGTADVATDTAFSTDDHVRIGSQTKTFATTVALQLVQEGKLSLDDKVSKWFPGVPNADTATLRHLMNHTSGIPTYTNDAATAQAIFLDPTRVWTEDELLGIVDSLPPDFAPGEEFAYSNTNTVLVGMIVERITGKSIGEEIRERIIEPLGLDDTSYPSDEETGLPEPFAHGYIFQKPDGLPTEEAEASLDEVGVSAELVDFTQMSTSWARAAGAMTSTLEDMRRYVEALATGKLLDKKTQSERVRDLVPAPPEAMQGIEGTSMGLGIMETGGFYGHQGGVPGYNTVSMHNKKLGVTIVLEFNKLYNQTEPLIVMQDLIRVLYPDHTF